MEFQVSKVVLAGLVVGLAMGLVPVPVSAAGAKDPVAVRQAAMKQLGAHMKGIGGFLKGGKRSGTATDAALRGQAIAAIARKIPALFPKGTSVDDLGLMKSGAKAVIWQRWADFKAASASLDKQAMAFTTAAETGDKGQIKAAMKSMGKVGCGGCHKNFRQKRKK